MTVSCIANIKMLRTWVHIRLPRLWMKTLISFCLGMLTAVNAIARNYPIRYCANSSKQNVSSSIYYVPNRSDFKSLSAFKKAVRMQGTGTLSEGRVLRYNGKTQKLPAGCSTAVGKAGKCLLPFFSIAADPRYHKMGEIIFIESMKDRMIKLPNGQTFKHPGFFVVDDTGKAIKGRNRFDFFTGSMKPSDVNNAFGYKSKTGLPSIKSCNREYRVVKNKTAINYLRFEFETGRRGGQKDLSQLAQFNPLHPLLEAANNLGTL